MTEMKVSTKTRYEFRIEIELSTDPVVISDYDKSRGVIWYHTDDGVAGEESEAFIDEVIEKMQAMRKKKKIPKGRFDLSTNIHFDRSKNCMVAIYTSTAMKNV